MSTNKFINAYKNANREAVAESEDPQALIMVLLDELLRAMRAYVTIVEKQDDAKARKNERNCKVAEVIPVEPEVLLPLPAEPPRMPETRKRQRAGPRLPWRPPTPLPLKSLYSSSTPWTTPEWESLGGGPRGPPRRVSVA